MKKYLPNNKHSLPFADAKRKGFTLVELLVVVSIIAILAVVGLTIFTGVQARGRDATRKSDIEAISKAMEVNYSETTGQYLALSAAWFSSGVVPSDPLNGANSCQTLVCKYCVKSSPGNCAAGDSTVAAGTPAAGATYRICANLEVGSPTFICQANQR